jgi:hypothetical protein
MGSGASPHAVEANTTDFTPRRVQVSVIPFSGARKHGPTRGECRGVLGFCPAATQTSSVRTPTDPQEALAMIWPGWPWMRATSPAGIAKLNRLHCTALRLAARGRKSGLHRPRARPDVQTASAPSTQRDPGVGKAGQAACRVWRWASFGLRLSSSVQDRASGGAVGAPQSGSGPASRGVAPLLTIAARRP